MKNKQKEFTFLNRAQLKQLADIRSNHSLEVSRFTEEQKDKQDLDKLLLNTLPWSFWYEVPSPVFITFMLEILGMTEVDIDALNQPDPEQYLFDYLDNAEEPTDEEINEYSDEDKSLITSFFYALNNNLDYFTLEGKFLNDVLIEARQSDQALLNAIAFDKTIISSPTAGRRIQLAAAKNEKSFYDKLSRALKKEGRIRDEELDDTKFALFVLNHCNALEGLTQKEIYTLVNKELRVLPGFNDDNYETFRQFFHRLKKKM